MSDITLESLIQEHKERVTDLIYHSEVMFPYYDYENMEAYINSKDPDIASLYHCFQKLADRFIGKEE